MSELPREIRDFIDLYGVEDDEIWQVRSGAYAIKHKAIERIAAQEHICIETMEIYHFSAMEKTAAVMVTAVRVPEKDQVVPLPHRVITTGEASPTNNKNSYPLAMAEKRAVDRAVLKLLNTYGALYSDAEADEFTQTGDKHTLLKSSQYARSEYQKLLTAIRNCSTPDMLDEFSKAYKEQIRHMPEEWKAELRREWAERAEELDITSHGSI